MCNLYPLELATQSHGLTIFALELEKAPLFTRFSPKMVTAKNSIIFTDMYGPGNNGEPLDEPQNSAVADAPEIDGSLNVELLLPKFQHLNLFSSNLQVQFSELNLFAEQAEKKALKELCLFVKRSVSLSPLKIENHLSFLFARLVFSFKDELSDANAAFYRLTLLIDNVKKFCRPKSLGIKSRILVLR
jgi:hypothetical protein